MAIFFAFDVSFSFVAVVVVSRNVLLTKHFQIKNFWEANQARERALLNIALDSLWQLHQYRFRLQWRHISKLRQNILIFNGPNSASFIFVLLSFCSNTNFAEKTVGFRGIWTRIIGIEGEHLTTATTEGQQKISFMILQQAKFINKCQSWINFIWQKNSISAHKCSRNWAIWYWRLGQA